MNNRTFFQERIGELNDIIRIFFSPLRYLQDQGVLQSIDDYSSKSDIWTFHNEYPLDASKLGTLDEVLEELQGNIAGSVYVANNEKFQTDMPNLFLRLENPQNLRECYRTFCKEYLDSSLVKQRENIVINPMPQFDYWMRLEYYKKDKKIHIASILRAEI